MKKNEIIELNHVPSEINALLEVMSQPKIGPLVAS